MKSGYFNQIVVYSQIDALRFKRNKFQTLLPLLFKPCSSNIERKQQNNNTSRTINRSHFIMQKDTLHALAQLQGCSRSPLPA
jgi:hypothetical protein